MTRRPLSLVAGEEGEEGVHVARSTRYAAPAAVACHSPVPRRQSPAMPADQRFTRAQVAARNSKKDAVFVIDNLVYDVTPFLDEHPGGHEVLLNVAGRDASEDFEDVGHSLDAKDLMKKFQVGELVEEERSEVRARAPAWGGADPQRALQEEAGFLGSWKFPLLLGLALTALYAYLFN